MGTGGGAGAALEALVLAAGAGSRFGGGKLTAPWRGGVLLDGALAAAFAAPVRSVTVVTGADPRVAAAALAFAANRSGSGPVLRLVWAADHAEGMSASLRAGLKSLPRDAAGAFVFLGDMPLVPTEVLAALAEAVGRGAPAAAPVFAGRRGHPVLFGRGLFEELAALEGDAGARAVLERLGERLSLVAAPGDGAHFDVDVPEALEAAPRP